MIRRERAFIEAAVAAVEVAKELVLPVLMVETPHDPWTPERIRSLQGRREELGDLVADAVDLLVDLEVPFLVEEVRLAADGIDLASDMQGFEVAMVEFERAFWETRFAEYREDPERWSLQEVEHFDVCDDHQLSSARVRAVIEEHGVTSFADLAPYLGTNVSCSTCHTAVTKMLLHELKRSKHANGR